MRQKIFLNIHVTTGAKQTTVVSKDGACWNVRLHAKPVDGAANAALIELIAQEFKVTKSLVVITHGLHSRQKRVKIILP